MEKIYIPKNFRCSSISNVKEAFERLKKIGDSHVENLGDLEEEERYNSVCNVLGLDELEQRRLLDATSLDLITIEDEDERKHSYKGLRNIVKVTHPSKISEDASKLFTVKVRGLYKSTLSDLYAKHRYQRDKYECHTEVVTQEKIVLTEPHCIITVRVYNPFIFEYPDLKKFKPNSVKNLKFSHEILALSTNTLVELRDRIRCYSDLGLCSEVDDPATYQIDINAKETYPSGFFFIENVFYNDNRHPDSIDYSEVVRKWGLERGMEMDTACMASARIEDLSIRFGYPYVYQHQGKCEHIFVFSDAWLLSESDNMNIQEYPLYTSVHHHYTRLCGICAMEGAKWICIDSDRLPQDRMLLCNNCFMQYNYIDGKKVGSFKAFPYFNKNVTV